jgi:hypothetical protein
MCTVLLPPGVNPIAVKYIYIIYHNICTSLIAIIVNIFLVNDLPEDGLQGTKHVEGASQNNQELFMVKMQLDALNTV